MGAMSRDEFEAFADEWQQTGGWQVPAHVVTDLIALTAEALRVADGVAGESPRDTEYDWNCEWCGAQDGRGPDGVHLPSLDDPGAHDELCVWARAARLTHTTEVAP